nr:hypothetical protein B0A51_10865 [Rachicladosporium sp. CCFEE 5018]
MKLLVLLALCSARVIAAPTNMAAQDSIATCESAPNCETCIESGGTHIRFKEGMAPGSMSYDTRLADVHTEFNTADKKRTGFTTKVQFGDKKVNYGTTSLTDIYAHLNDFCHDITCDASGADVDSTFIETITALGTTGTTPQRGSVHLKAEGQYSGPKHRAAFLAAAIAAIGQNVQSDKTKWRWYDKKSGGDSGEVVLNTQSESIDVVTYTTDHPPVLVGFLKASMDTGGGDGDGWCGKMAGALGGIVGVVDKAIGPVGAALSGVIAAACS